MSYSHRGYIKISGVADTEGPFTDLPQIPFRIWMKFLLAEVNLQNEDGFLRRALKSIRVQGHDRLASITDQTKAGVVPR